MGTIVIGTGRCGSTLISDLVNQHPDILSLSEFFVMAGFGLFRIKEPIDGPALWEKCSYMSDHAAGILTAGPPVEILADVSGGEPYPPPLDLITIPHIARRSGEPEDAVRECFRVAITIQPELQAHEHFDQIFEALRLCFQKKDWVERSGTSLEHAKHFLKSFPTARYLHIWRNGVDTALSMATHLYLRVRIAYQWTRKDMTVPEALAVEVPIAEYGHYWSNQIVSGLEALNQAGVEILHVQYEQLVNDPDSQIPRIFDFLQMPVDQAFVEEAKKLVRPLKERGEVQDLGSLVKACEPGMKVLNGL